MTTNILDLWTEPRFNSERASQLLFGEPLAISDEQEGYALVRQTDGYAGWADKRHLREIDENACNDAVASRKWVISAPQVRLLDRKGEGVAPFFLYYGTLVHVVSTGALGHRIKLPDGSGRLLRATALQPLRSRKGWAITGRMLVAEAKRFLGVPYLWGGLSPAGFDCSGLVQTVCRRFGINMPRDTKDQISSGVEVSRDDIRTGDLLFFKRHVGFAIDKARLIHSSIGGAGVRINSIGPGLPDYRADLDQDFNQARRIL